MFYVLDREVLSNVIAHEYTLLEWHLKSIGEFLRTFIIVEILLILQWVIIANTGVGAEWVS